MISMLGVALGVLALIVVLSVMNGFGERNSRAHSGHGCACHTAFVTGEVADWQSLIGQISAFPHGAHRLL
ncbi:MAG: hypothetical protein ACYYK0_01085 [Candidatus Eutrophobiaceae bacterium]